MYSPNGGADPSQAPATVLLVEAEEEEYEQARSVLSERLPQVEVLRASSVAEARLLSAQKRVDLVIAAHALPDGSGAELAEADDGLDGAPVCLFVRGSSADAYALRAENPRVFDCLIYEKSHAHLLRSPVYFLQALAAAKAGSNGKVRSDGPSLQEIRRTISRVNHDLNNPLSIISGNAQLLAELARMLDLDSDLAQPIEDIEAASSRVGEILRHLVDLRDQIAADGAPEQDVRAELRELAS